MWLTPERKSALGSVLEAVPKIQSAWLFGSRAKGQERPDSDLDIGLLCGEPLTFDEYSRLIWELEEVAQSARVDLVELSFRSPILAFEAISGVEVLRRDPEVHAGFCSLVGSFYEDAMWNIERSLRWLKESPGVKAVQALRTKS